MKTLVVRSLAAAMCVVACGAKSEAITITYLVDIAQSGDVVVGSTLDWTLSYVIENPADPMIEPNFGVRTASVDLFNSTGEAMAPGAISFPFSFAFSNPGNVVAGGLEEIGYSLIQYNAGLIAGEAGNLGPIVFATGSYVVNTLGMHTLSVDPAASLSQYYFAPNDADFLPYDAVITNAPGSSDSVNVVAMAGVPEPASMLLASTLVVPGVIGVRRRRRQRAAKQSA